jgi:DNA polymerase zeta
MLEDPRTEPQYGERVPYVVITGGPGARLIDRCVGPEVLLHDPQSELDAEYYISKNIIPPLERIFNLVGANVRQWYDEMPKFQRIRRIEGTALPANGRDLIISKKTLESYMKSSSCVVCRNKLDAEISICRSCLEQPHMALLTLKSRLVKAERRAVQYDKVCRSCEGFAWGEDVKCVSKDCPVFYSRTRHRANLGNERAVLEPVVEMLESVEPVFDW